MAAYQPSTSTSTYPDWFIKHLAKMFEWAEQAPEFASPIGMYVQEFPIHVDGQVAGTVHYLDDQWQFEPDVAYWGLLS